jgi:ferredoxin
MQTASNGEKQTLNRTGLLGALSGCEPMGKRYKVIFDREACIGALACNAVAPELWLLADDGKVDLKGAKKRDDGKFELIIEEKEFTLNKEAADSCPVYAIVVEEMLEESK